MKAENGPRHNHEIKFAALQRELAFAENKIECHAGSFNIRVKTESRIENVFSKLTSKDRLR